MGKKLEQCFTKKAYQNGHKGMKRCSLAVRKIENKTYYKPKCLKLNRWTVTMLSRISSNKNIHLYIAGGNVNWGKQFGIVSVKLGYNNAMYQTTRKKKINGTSQKALM